MRVDVIAEFYVRVAAQPDAVAAAAQTLGLRTMEPEQLKELVEGKFVDALRTAAAEMTMEELHEKRGAYVKRVREAVAEDLTKNGLELEVASLTQLDQTGMEFFNPSNAFDAEGLTRLTEQIEHRKKQRNDVEQDTLIAIRNKNLEAEKLSLEIDREGEYARLAQQREVEIARARQRAELIDRARAARAGGRERADRRQADASTRRASAPSRRIEQERIGKERAIQSGRDRAPHVARAGRAAARDRGRAREQGAERGAGRRPTRRAPTRSSAEEKVFTAREVEMAERKKAIELIGARAGRRARGAAPDLAGAGREGRQRRPRRGGARPGRGRRRCRQDPLDGDARARRDRGRGAAHDERGAQHALARSAHVGAAHEAGREGRGDHPRIGAADGAHRGHQDPARRRARRLGRAAATAQWRRRRQLRRRRWSTRRCASARRRRWSTSCCARSASRAATSSAWSAASAARRPRCRRRRRRTKE